MSLTLEDALSAPHNLLVDEDLLFVGWYNDGIRVFRYDVSDPENPAVEPVAFQAVRTGVEPDAADESEIYDGIWGVNRTIITDKSLALTFNKSIRLPNRKRKRRKSK